MSSAQTAAAAQGSGASQQANPSGPSELQRQLNMFFAPGQTFLDLKRVKRWWAPWLVLSLVMIPFAYTVDQKIGFELVAQNQRTLDGSAERFESMPPAQRATAEAQMAAGMKYFTYGAGLMLLVFLGILAAIYLATFNFGMGGEVKFATSLAIIMYSSLPHVLRSLLAILTIYLGADAAGFHIQTPVATSLAYFVNPAENKVLYTFGTYLDLFTLWSTYLTGLGFATLTKFKTSTCMMVSFGIWLAIALLFTGIAAI